MAEALEAEVERFERITGEREDFAEALEAVLQSAFDLSEREVLRNRLLVSEQVLVGVHRTSAREEEARQLARAHARPRVQVGGVPDPRDGAGRDPGGGAAAARARSWGSTTASSTGTAPRRARAAEVADFYVPRCLAVAGLPLRSPRRPRERRQAHRGHPARARRSADAQAATGSR